MSRAIRLKLQRPLHIRLWRAIILILFFFLSVAVVLGGVYWFITLPRFRISKVTVTGNPAIEKQKIREHISAHLASSVFFLIPRNSVFTIAKETLTASLLASFPRLKTVNARWTPKTTDLSFLLTDRQPRFTWGTGTSSTLYFADEDTFIFSRANLATTTLFHLWGGIIGEPVGKRVLDEDELVWVRLVKNDFAPLGVLLTGAELTGNDDIIFATNEQWKLKTNTKIDSRALATSLFTVLRALETTGKGSREQLDYVDLRFPAKAYFRFRDTATTTISS